MRSAADCILRAHPGTPSNSGRREEGGNHSTAYRPIHCFYCAWLLITTSCQLRGSFLPCLRQPQGFRPATRCPSNDEEAMAFQRPQATTDIPFVPLQRVHQRRVTARDHPVRPLVVSSQPAQNVFLKLR